MILLQWIVTLVSREPLRFAFVGLLRKYLVHLSDSLSMDCYDCRDNLVSVSRDTLFSNLVIKLRV